MNELCADIGYKSINHAGEQLCGDHVDIVEQGEDSMVIVLADGMGSGVKASILSTLTAKIISTMIAEGLSLTECVSTIAKTLPVDKEHQAAYSTFTVMHIRHNKTIELIQYDNPQVIMLRNDRNVEYDKNISIIDGKTIYHSVIPLQENDVFVAMSDGCPHAGPGVEYNMKWQEKDIVEFMEVMSIVGYTAKGLASLLVDECEKLYAGNPRDDATACVVRMRRRVPMNLLFGPPANRDDSDRMMQLFFARSGLHVICGGTTSAIAAKWLNKPLQIDPASYNETDGIPPTSILEGVDLVTEGVLTISRVVEYVNDYLTDNKLYDKWSRQKDGASRICRLMLEEATDINFMVGCAINPAHQDPKLPFNFNLKMNQVKELSASLRQLGKNITVNYF